MGFMDYLREMKVGGVEVFASRFRKSGEIIGSEWDEGPDEKQRKKQYRAVYKFSFIPKDALKTMGTSVARITGMAKSASDSVKWFDGMYNPPTIADVAVSIFDKDAFLKLAPSDSSTIKLIRAQVEKLPAGRRDNQFVFVKLPIKAMVGKGHLYADMIEL